MDIKRDIRDLRENLEDLENVIDEAEQEELGSAVYEISSYGADYDVDGLVKRVGNDIFFVPPFQRQYVWNQKQASRFIESLLLGLPVPGIFVYKEKETEKYLIIDGQQRLESLRRFFSGSFSSKGSSEGKNFRLIDVDERWDGRTFLELGDTARSKLENSIVHTTVFRQDDPDDNKSVYLVFERLNTGGSKLSPQEIRHCVNYGPFTELLEELNQVTSWRAIYGQNQSVRMKDREMILRFFALNERWESYKRPMQGFLNAFMEKYRSLSDEEAHEFRTLFTNTIQFCHKELGNKAFRPKGPINVSVFDGVMVGTAKGMKATGGKAIENYSNLYKGLLEDADFRSAHTGSTTDEMNVSTRIHMAIERFAP